MSESFENELQAPDPDESPLPGQLSNDTETIDYLESYRFIFQEPHWATTTLLMTVCVLSTLIIPYIGLIVVMGYLCEVFDHLQTRQPGYPAFEFGNFGRYLGRGIWPFLASMIIQLLMIGIVIPLAVAVFVIGMYVVPKLGPIPDSFSVLGFIALLCIWLGFNIGMNMVSVPVMLRAAIRQDLAQLFRFDFVRDFLQKTWKELLLSGLFFMFTMHLLLFGGMLLACVGVFFTISLANFASAHLGHQLYDVYLNRGGVPVPRKPPPPDDPPEVS